MSAVLSHCPTAKPRPHILDFFVKAASQISALGMGEAAVTKIPKYNDSNMTEISFSLDITIQRRQSVQGKRVTQLCSKFLLSCCFSVPMTVNPMVRGVPPQLGLRRGKNRK